MLRSLLGIVAFSGVALLSAQEVCDNGIDDNSDGLIDLNDPQCACSTQLMLPGTQSYIPNHDFEERLTDGEGHTCCPLGWSTPDVDWLLCAAGWAQATNATSDYYHSCSFYPPTYPFPSPEGGEASAGFIPLPDWMEYVGLCLMDPATDPHPLLAGTSYTLSLWFTLFSSTTAVGGLATYGNIYHDPLPLVVYGNPACQPFPLPTIGCVGDLPGWVELGRVYHVPNGEWSHLSFTFTPTVEMRTIIIGAGCDLPASFAVGSIMGPNGTLVASTPYALVDDLMLTLSSDQVMTPVSSTGHPCHNDVVVTASPPPGSSDHQWYRDGVAIVGQTGLVLDVSALGLGPGVYALSSNYQGECLMGTTNVAPATAPYPLFIADPAMGCAPLTVAFADTTGPSIVASAWSFGDGGSGSGTEVSHTYTIPGTYDVRLTVTTDAGCTRDSLFVGAVVVAAGVAGAITADPNPTDVDHTTVSLSASGSTGDIIAWWWDLDDVAPGTSNSAALTATFPAEPGSYPVTLAIRSAEGCVDTVRSLVIVWASGEVEMPNVFSPNGDGHNDVFRPMDITQPLDGLDIYNRWGQLVFSTNATDGGWDGRANGSPAPDGTYYYIVHGALSEGASRTGHVTLLR